MMKKIQLATLALGLLSLPIVHAEQTSIGTDDRTIVNAQDVQWMKRSAQGDMMEVALGKLALIKAVNPEAKAFGKKMIKDHSNDLITLKALASAKNVQLPAEVTPDQLVVLHYFANSKSFDWSYDYVQFEVDDHIHAVADTKKEIALGSDEDVIGHAKKVLPILKTHLQLAEQIAGDLSEPK